MNADVLLIGIAQVALVIAGSTAVTSALAPPGGEWSADQKIRQRAIVSTSFNVVFESLLAVILMTWFADSQTGLIVASAAVALYTGWVVLSRARQFMRTDAIRTRSGQLLFLLGPAAVLIFAANAIVLWSVAVFAFALCVQLSVAVVSFYSVVSAAMR